jgi:hypothetical protein
MNYLILVGFFAFETMPNIARYLAQPWRGVYPRWVAKRPLRPFRQIELSEFTTAAQPSGVVRHSDESPRHRGNLTNPS